MNSNTNSRQSSSTATSSERPVEVIDLTDSPPAPPPLPFNLPPPQPPQQTYHRYRDIIDLDTLPDNPPQPTLPWIYSHPQQHQRLQNILPYQDITREGDVIMLGEGPSRPQLPHPSPPRQARGLPSFLDVIRPFYVTQQTPPPPPPPEVTHV